MSDWKAEIRGRLQSLRLTPTREDAIVEELAQYLDDCYAELLAGGATEAEAYRQTLAELSGRNVSITLRHFGEKFRLQEEARRPLPVAAAAG